METSGNKVPGICSNVLKSLRKTGEIGGCCETGETSDSSNDSDNR